MALCLLSKHQMANFTTILRLNKDSELLPQKQTPQSPNSHVSPGAGALNSSLTTEQAA